MKGAAAEDATSTRSWRHWIPAIVWAGAIWMFSTQSFSTESTAQWIIPALRWLLRHASPEQLELLHFLIRKSGHVVEYSILSLLVFYGVRGRRRGWQWSWGVTAVAIAAAYAISDELHQTFVPGRTAAVGDVLLDSGAAALGQLAAWLWNRRRSVIVRPQV